MTNWKRETELFRKIAQGIAKNEELRRICCAEAGRARHLRSDELSRQKEECKSTVKSAYGSDSGIARQGEFVEWCKRIP